VLLVVQDRLAQRLFDPIFAGGIVAPPPSSNFCEAIFIRLRFWLRPLSGSCVSARVGGLGTATVVAAATIAAIPVALLRFALWLALFCGFGFLHWSNSRSRQFVGCSNDRCPATWSGCRLSRWQFVGPWIYYWRAGFDVCSGLGRYRGSWFWLVGRAR